MIQVKFSSTLLKFTSGNALIEVAHQPDLMSLISSLTESHPALKTVLMGQNEQLRPYISFFVNNKDFRILNGTQTELSSGDTVAIMSPVAGG